MTLATVNRGLVAVLLPGILLLCAPAPAAAQEYSEKGVIGVGIILGEPTGLSAKMFLGGRSDMAVDAAAGSAVVGGGLQAHADLLWHPWILTEEDKFVLPAYLGVGIRLLDADRGRTASDFHIGVRAVVGMAFDFKTIPLDVFVEIAGVGDYIFSDDAEEKGFGVDLNGGAGVRYWF